MVRRAKDYSGGGTECSETALLAMKPRSPKLGPNSIQGGSIRVGDHSEDIYLGEPGPDRVTL